MDVPENDPKTALDTLEACSSDTSRLLSVYVPPEHLVDEVIVFLGDERDNLDRIRSADRRTRIEDALTRLQDRLAEYDEPPESGMALFCGRVDGEWIETALDEPPQSVESFRYRCDEAFLIEPFRDLFDG